MSDMRSWDKRFSDFRAFSGRAFEAPSRSVVRGANTTQYTAGDEYGDGTALVFGTAAVYAGGGGLLTHALCVMGSNRTTKPNLRLYLFSGSPAMAGDNSPWIPSVATLGSVVAKADLDIWEVGNGSSDANGNSFSIAEINRKYRCGSADTKLYGVLVERGTYTPLSAEALTVTLHGEYD